MDVEIIDGKYRVLRILGQGGMGAVYEAEHLVTGRRVALKVIVSELLAKEDGIIARFQREARASGAIDSQYVVQVLDSGVDTTTKNPYLVMEYLAGEDLGQLIHRLDVLPPDLALRITAQACLGLQRAHDAGIIHRDIKSANTFLARRDHGERIVKLLDFGIAKVRADQFAEGGDHKLTRTGSMIGSPLYMSPEQARGSKNLDSRADLWSLGVALYESLAGSTPNHHCDTIGNLILALCAEDADPIQNRAPWVSSDVAAVVHKALARDPEKRFSSAAEMHAAIVAITGPSIAIHEDMLVPLPEHTRRSVAPRANADTGNNTGPLVVRPSGAPVADVLAVTTLAVAAATGPGLGQSTAASARSPLKWLYPVLGVAGMVGITAGVFVYRSSNARPNAALAAEPPKPIPEATGGGIPVKGPEKTKASAKVTLSPASAQATLDGNPVSVQNGEIEVSGAIGSVHRIEISLDGKSAKADIVLSEGGAVPARVELAMPTAASAQKPIAAGKSPQAPVPASSAAAASTAATPATPKPTPPKPPVAAAPPSEPAINRNF